MLFALISSLRWAVDSFLVAVAVAPRLSCRAQLLAAAAVAAAATAPVLAAWPAVWREAALPQPLALVLGNELIGVDTQVLDACDGVVSIPMFGVKNSINVATAGAIVLWEALRQWEVSAEAEGAGLGQMRSQRAERPRPERADEHVDKSNSRQA